MDDPYVIHTDPITGRPLCYPHRSYSWAENADDMIKEIFRMYPELSSDDVLTRTLAYTKASMEETFGEPGNWEAGRHAA